MQSDSILMHSDSDSDSSIVSPVSSSAAATTTPAATVIESTNQRIIEETDELITTSIQEFRALYHLQLTTVDKKSNSGSSSGKKKKKISFTIFSKFKKGEATNNNSNNNNNNNGSLIAAVEGAEYVIRDDHDNNRNDHQHEEIICEQEHQRQQQQQPEEENLGDSSLMLTDAECLRFLRAMKFDPKRAVERYTDYIEFKIQKQWMHSRNDFEQKRIRPSSIEAQLRSGFIRLLPGRDNEGRGIIFVQPRYIDATNWELCLKTIWFVVEHALDSSEQNQKLGLTVISNAKGASKSNFSANLIKELLQSLQGRLPVRIGRLLIVNPPWFFKTVWSVANVFMKEKLRNRVAVALPPDASATTASSTSSSSGGGGSSRGSSTAAADDDDDDASSPGALLPQLTKFVELDQLPVEVGGALRFDHSEWVDSLLAKEKEDADDARKEHGTS